MINGVIFDMDGLMFDTERLSTKAWIHTATQLNIDIPMEFINSLKGVSAFYCKQLFQNRFGPSFDFEYARSLRTEHMNLVIKESGIPIKKGLIELLSYLKSNSIVAAVATSTNHVLAEKMLKMAGVYDYFETVVCGDSVVKSKPEPDIYLKALQIIGKSSDECFVLEDSPNGIGAGYAAKIRVIHIPDEIVIEDDVKKKVFKICCDLQEVITCIEKENNVR
ncbi:HAD family hydrolase [[Clostridium] fimetarium]|uniref:Haloacid dehalogenase superfamily, subfamily IA, variant 3 with third motif having DD or ED n=1 Tax=[Clostridium] fimetarium TaxID=99656 RepID=A0A1I0NRY3_9FIRM|nr:HAD family phosphatase [[Clostridium] fimetarium]SEW04181.1 haloacid dehalogenase superfamily, subfamily IA, variant 3 with third motif having DD or ED [[Clostridium] fimetarium]